MPDNMVMNTIPDVGFWYVESLDDPEFATAVDDLRAQGISADLEKREEAVYASLEWVLPTAVVIFVADKYFGTMFEELAKEHYPHIRKALARVIRRVFHRVGGAYLTVVASPPRKRSMPYEHVVSIYSRHRDGWPIKFLVDDSLPVETSIDEIFALMQRHCSGGGSVIDTETELIQFRRSTILVFVRHETGWKLVHPVTKHEEVDQQ
jgi:hypothetical protein